MQAELANKETTEPSPAVIGQQAVSQSRIASANKSDWQTAIRTEVTSKSGDTATSQTYPTRIPESSAREKKPTVVDLDPGKNDGFKVGILTHSLGSKQLEESANQFRTQSVEFSDKKSSRRSAK